MNLSLHQLREVATKAGITDKTLASALAATLFEESHGDPMRVGDRRDGAPTSFGIGQVHAPAHPEIAALTRSVMAAPMVTIWGRALAEVKLLLPIVEDAARQAIAAANELRARGFQPDLVDTLVIMDAAWQGPGVGDWARETATGNPDHIRDATSPGRGSRVRSHLQHLGVHATRDQYGWVLPVGLLVGGGFLAWAAVEAMDRKKR